MLNPRILGRCLKERDFVPEIDLFATRLNHQFSRYCSFRPDPGAEFIDASSMSWAHIKFYAFPPFSLIPLVLKKIQEDRAMGVCVVPRWTTQAWYPRVFKMAMKPPIPLNPGPKLLELVSQPQQTHPLHQKLSLLLLSGRS